MEYLLLGFFTSLSLIFAIGAQNIFVIEQIKQTKKTYCFFNPCSITKIFCAPNAKIKLNPVNKPNNAYSIRIN